MLRSKSKLVQPTDLNEFRARRRGRRPSTFEGVEWRHTNRTPNDTKYHLGTRLMDVLVFNTVIGSLGQIALDTVEKIQQKPSKYQLSKQQLFAAVLQYEAAIADGMIVGKGSESFDVQVLHTSERFSKKTDVTLTRTPENTKGGFQSIRKLGIVFDEQGNVTFFDRTQDEEGDTRIFARKNEIQHFRNATEALMAAAPTVPLDAQTYLAL